MATNWVDTATNWVDIIRHTVLQRGHHVLHRDDEVAIERSALAGSIEVMISRRSLGRHLFVRRLISEDELLAVYRDRAMLAKYLIRVADDIVQYAARVLDSGQLVEALLSDKLGDMLAINTDEDEARVEKAALKLMAAVEARRRGAA